MGQKTNPNIFRLGVNKTWKTEFFEKKKKELPLYTFKDLEIKNYIERFLETHGIILHDYKQHYSNATLNFYISYFITSEFILNKDKVENILLLNKSGNKKKVAISTQIKPITNKQTFCLKHRGFWKSKDLKSSYELKKYINSNHYDSEFLIQRSLKRFSENDSSNFSGTEKFKINGVLNNMFKVLSLFTNNKFNIAVNFCCINKDLNFLKVTQKKNFILLQKFRNSPFLKEGIELLFHVVCNKNSANLLAKFVSFQIQKIKRHKFFLSFLKQSLTVMLNSNVSKIKGVKILVKGRLNGVPRAKHRMITVGDVPAQSIFEKIDYSQATSHNSNGSYGVKVWVVEKNNRN
jgi:ribosomal protein S3